MDQLISSLDAIAVSAPDDRIPQACCAFARYSACSVTPIKETCTSFDKAAEEYIAVKMIRGYAAEVLDLACQGYDWGHEKCNNVIIPDGALTLKDGKLAPTVEGQPFNKSASILPPFINIFTKL